jgi:hypothetical protein
MDTSHRESVSSVEETENFRREAHLKHNLTQKDYFNSLRNRLYNLEEQFWLHQYAMANPSGIIEPLVDNYFKVLNDTKDYIINELALFNLLSDKAAAEANNLTYAATFLQRTIDHLQRQTHVEADHINQLMVSSSSGRIINLMRGHGSLFHRLLPSNTKFNSDILRQFQHLAFSRDHRYCAAIEMFVRNDDSPVPLRSQALVYEVENSPEKYGEYESQPYFNSGPLPGAPFFLRFSPNGEQLAFLSSNTEQINIADDGADNTRQESEASAVAIGVNNLVVLDWMKYRILPKFKDEHGRWVDIPIAGAKSRIVMEGNPIFFSYTTSSPHNATIVAHANRVINELDSSGAKSETAVWMLTNSSNADDDWEKLSSSSMSTSFNADMEQKQERHLPQVTWFTPQCHSAGGGDNVLLVEDGYLVTKALSRWKRNILFQRYQEQLSNGQNYQEAEKSSYRHSQADISRSQYKRLLAVRGNVHFLVSPDHSKVAVMEEVTSGSAYHYRLRIVDGEQYLDPANLAMLDDPFLTHEAISQPEKQQYQAHVIEFPANKKAVAFWFSPDSSQLLLFLQSDPDETATLLTADTQLTAAVFNIPLKQYREYVTFRPTSYFRKTYLTFFTQFAQVYNPWAPDSKSFLYITSSGLHNIPVVESRASAGMGSWINRGATFGTWSRT